MHTDFSKAWRWFHLQSFRPRNQCGQDGGMQLNAVGELVRATRERGVTGQAHRRFARWHGCLHTKLGEETSLTQKSLAAAEPFRIDELQKHRCAPALFAIGASMTAEGVGERFDEQAQ